MNKSAKTWLLFMMVPFFIGVLIHFIVPLEIIITANPKLEDTYNGYKIQVEQNTVRALAFLNSRVITNRLQMYENIRSTFIRLFQRGDIYKTINLTQIIINNAYELANGNVSDPIDLNHSMWYSPNVSNISEMNPIQQSIYYSYAQVEPFLESIFISNDEIYKGLRDLSVMVNYDDYQFYFQYPSAVIPQLQQANASILGEYYFNSIINNETEKLRITIFDRGTLINLCATVQIRNSSIPNTVVCMGLDIYTLIKDITTVLGVPEFQLSTNNYYLLRPLYKFEGFQYPQIIANFTSTNLSQIQIPIQNYFSLEDNPLPASIFSGITDFSLNIQRHEKTKTYYTIPITINNYDDTNQVAIYFVVLNNFAKAQLSEQSQDQRIAIIMIVPSVLLLLISIIVTTLILRSILKKLDQALGLMGEYCSLIKRGDLELQIPQYTETEDLKELFQELQKLNQLSKYADLEYFNVPKPERIIRFLKCLKLFDELGYDKTNLYENICECYVSIGDYQNAIKFLRLSIDMSVADTYGKYQEIENIYEQKINKRYKPDKNVKRKEKAVKRKILRLCRLLYDTYTPGNTQMAHELTTNSEFLRKISYPEILNCQYISCLFYILSCKIKMNDLADIEPKIEILGELVKGYEQIHDLEQNRQFPPDVMFSYWYSLVGSFKMREKKFAEAFQYFIKALQGNRFDPMQHVALIPTIQMILQIYGLNKNELKKCKFMQQYKPRGERQYIFLFDVGKPQMSMQQLSNWKKKARKMADHIFQKQIKNTDRISIIQFCLDIKIVCNLIEKGNRYKILKKQLMSSIKARDQTIVALPIHCLSKSIERVKNLKKQKIFLIFLKGGMYLSGDDIFDQIKDVQNSKFLFFAENPNIIRQKNDSFFVLDFQHELDVDRILEQKTLKEADNVIYIL